MKLLILILIYIFHWIKKYVAFKSKKFEKYWIVDTNLFKINVKNK